VRPWLQLEVKPDMTSPQHCTVVGDGLTGGTVGTETTFTINTHDMHGNFCYHDEDMFHVVMKAGNSHTR